MGWRERITAGGTPLGLAGVSIALAIGAVDARMGEEWSAGAFLAIHSVAALVILGAGLLAADGADRADGPATALMVSGLVLLLGALSALAGVLGGDGAGTVAWVTLVFSAVAAYVAVKGASPVCTLISALALGAAAVAAVVAFSDSDGVEVFRGVATAFAVVIAAGSTAIGDKHKSVQLVNAAGVAVLLLAVSLPGELYISSFSGSEAIYGGTDEWAALALIGGAMLIVYAMRRREAGAGYLGAATLFFFAMGTITLEPDASLDGWPLVLIALAIAATAFALLRPRETETTVDSG